MNVNGWAESRIRRHIGYLPASESLLTIWSDFLGWGLKKHTRFITRDYYERRSMLIIYAKSNWTNAQSSAIKMLVLLH